MLYLFNVIGNYNKKDIDTEGKPQCKCLLKSSENSKAIYISVLQTSYLRCLITDFLRVFYTRTISLSF